MEFEINDKNLILDIVDEFYTIALGEKKNYPDMQFVHPLDEDIKEILEGLKPSVESIEYSQSQQIDKLWENLLDKSIRCLRYFDNREPFKEDPKKRL